LGIYSVAREEVYRTLLMSGETVDLRVRYETFMVTKSDTRTEVAKPRPEVQRVSISPPMGAAPYDAWKPPRPVDYKGERIQVTAHITEFNEVVERWQFSDTDVRWYRVERYRQERVTVKVERRGPLA
jgi:hypothetical protein